MPAAIVSLSSLRTPCLVLDEGRMDHNLARMRAQLARLGVMPRPHVKTCKSLPIAQSMMATKHGPITVSTLAEAEHFLDAGVTDVLYAVGIAPNKLDHVLDLRAHGGQVTVTVDGVEAAREVAARRAAIPVVIEIDSDQHRAGLSPHDDALLATAQVLAEGAVLRGVMTHAGAAYECRTTAAITAMAERERTAVVTAATRLHRAGFACPIVSVGSTPTALFADDLTGVTEVRAGVYVFMDLVMVGLGVCDIDDIALSVLVTVIGHQRDKNWLITDGGWMALSRDRGTGGQAEDQGYGAVCKLDGKLLPDLIVHGTNQEHGLVSRRDGGAIAWQDFPVGTLLRILPNHACATAAQHDRYHVVRGDLTVRAAWSRISGW